MNVNRNKRKGKNRYSLKYYGRKNCNRLQEYDEIILAVNGTFLRRM